MTGAAMRLFYPGFASLEHKTSPKPLPCTRAKNAMYATHREFGALLNIKDLSLFLLALFLSRRMPRNVCGHLGTLAAFGNTRIESTR
jgi:hypothetical protein